MRTSTQTLIFIAVIAVVNAATAGDWNYLKTGADWTDGNCAKNQVQQSPINLVTDSQSLLTYTEDIHVAPGKAKFTQSNKGYTVVLNYKPANTGDFFIRAKLKNLKGELHSYDAIQFHFHAPSEHTVDGKYGDLEMHIVCARTDGTTTGRYLAVLGYVFNSDNSAPLVNLLTEVNSKVVVGKKTDDEVELEMQDFFKHIPQQSSFFHYEGGLTTPGCAEAVMWYVNKNVVFVPSTQLTKFRQLWVQTSFAGVSATTKGFGNNRVVQSLGNRKIYSGHYSVTLDTVPQEERKVWVRNLFIVLTVFLFVALIVVTGVLSMKGKSGEKYGDAQPKSVE